MLQRIASLLRIRPPITSNVGLLIASGATVPPDGSVGYQTSCIFQHTDGAHGTTLWTNEGDEISSTFAALDVLEGDASGSIKFALTATGPCISVADGYTKVFIETGTYASTADEGIVISQTNNRPVSFLFDDGGDVFTGAPDIRAGLFRILLTVDQPNQQTLNALRAQIKALNGIDITHANSVTAPLTGYLELDGAGARHLDGHVACVRAALETGAGAHTVDINLCGYEATLNSSGSFTAGTLSAFVANINNGTTLWQRGLQIDAGSCDIGVNIDAIATGIVITGVTQYAIDIATSGVIRMGVQDTGVDLTTAYPFAIDVQCESNADIVPGVTGSSAGIYARYAIETAQTTQCAMIGVWGKLRVKANLADGNHAGVMGWVEISGSTELGGIAATTTAAGSFSVIAPSTLDLSTGHLNGVVVDCSVDDAATITGILTGIRLKSSAGCYGWATGILVDLGTNVGAALELGSTGISIILPTSTNDAASSALLGLSIAAAGAMTVVTSGNPTFTGISITTPTCDCTADTIVVTGLHITAGTIEETAGTMTAHGVRLTGGTITSGDSTAVTIDGTWTNAFAFPAAGGVPVETGAYAVGGGTQVRISVLVGGSQYYVLASTAPTTA